MLFDNGVIIPCFVNPNDNVIIEIKNKVINQCMDMYMGTKVLWLLYAGTLGWNKDNIVGLVVNIHVIINH